MRHIFRWLIVVITLLTTTITLSQDSPIITPENAPTITELHRIGNGTVLDLVLSPTGDTFALPGYFGIWIHQVNAPSAPPILLDAEGAGVRSIGYSPDGRFIIASAFDETVTLWDIAKQTAVYQHTDLQIQKIAYSPNGQFIAGIDYDGNLTLLNAQTGDIISQTQLPTETLHLAFNPNRQEIAISGNWLLSDFPKRGIYLIDVSNPSEPSITSHLTDMEVVYDLDYSPSGDLLLGYDFATVMIWDMRDENRGVLLHTYPQDTAIWDYDVQFDATGEHFLVASENGQVSFSDVATGEFVHSINHSQPVHRVAFSSDGTLYTVANGTVQSWDVENFTAKQVYEYGYVSFAPKTISFNPSSTHLVIGKNYQIELLDTTTWQSVALLDNNASADQVLYVTDDKLITTGSSVILWDMANQQIIKTIDVPAYSEIAVSPSGHLGAISMNEDGLMLIDPQTGDMIETIPQSGDDVEYGRGDANIVFSPNEEFVAWVYADTVYVWHIYNRELEFTYPDCSRVDWLAYHPSGNLLVGCEVVIDSMVVELDGLKGVEISRFNVRRSMGNPRKSALSPDGRIVAITEDDIYLFDFETGKLLVTLSNHKDEATGITFSPDGRYLVSTSGDGTIRIWGIAP